MKNHIFISYAHADAVKVTKLVDGLVGAGLDIWRDQESLCGGDIWTEALVDAIIEARGLVFVASVESINSYHVKRELHIACDEKKKIAPILIEPFTLPAWARYILAGLHHVYYDSERIDSLCQKVCASLRAPAASPTSSLITTDEHHNSRDLAARFLVLDRGRVLVEQTLDKDVVSIGRKRECDLVPRLLLSQSDQQCRQKEILNHSRVHAYVRWNMGRYDINDVSTHGTLLNGTRIADIATLSDGDVISIGEFQLVFRTVKR